MQKQILNELKELRSILAQLIGSSDLPVDEQFSIEAINKAAKEFQKLAIERGEWVSENDISKCIRGAAWHSGKFIREEFGFKRFFKKSRTYYYYKKDLIALGKELKERNIDLSRYIELKSDQANFKKKIAAIATRKNKKDKDRPYQITSDLKDITTSAPPAPSADLVREDLKQLKEEFFQFKLAEYVDIYKGTYAMVKFEYRFDRYLNSELKKRSKRWCENFNYANEALQIITKKKDVFVAVKEEDMIQL